MPGEPLFRVTHSKVQSFLNCRKQYWFQYESGLPQPEDIQTAAGIVGKGVHLAMKTLCDTDNPADGEHELDKYLRMPVHDIAGPGTEPHGLAFRLFEAGCAAHASIVSEDRWAEHKTWKPDKAAQVNVYAQIDRVDRIDAGRWQIVDWKTGLQDRDEVTDAQLDLGHVAARTSFAIPRDVSMTAIAWNLRTGHQRVRVLRFQDVDGTVRKYASLANRIRATAEWPATPGPACRFCVWRPQCPDAARVEVSPWDEDDDDMVANTI